MQRQLLNDVSRCLGIGCDERNECLRYLQRDSGGDRTPVIPTLKDRLTGCRHIEPVDTDDENQLA